MCASIMCKDEQRQAIANVQCANVKMEAGHALQGARKQTVSQENAKECSSTPKTQQYTNVLHIGTKECQ